MKQKVKLIKLSPEQVVNAKEVNGSRKKITHAVVCENYGNIFGTEQHCRKYFSAWSKIFPKLFSGGVELNKYELKDYETTFNLVNILIDANDSLESNVSDALKELETNNPPKKKSILARLFGK